MLIHPLSWYISVAAAKSLQSCPTLCDPIDGSPPGSSVPGILQARTLEWGAISFSNAWKWKVKVKSLSRAQLCATPWTAAHQAPPSMEFPRQEYWSGVPLPSLLALKTLASSQKELSVTLHQVFSSHLHKPLGLLFSSSGLCFCWDWFPRSLLRKYKSIFHSHDLLCLTGSRLAPDHS